MSFAATYFDCLNQKIASTEVTKRSGETATLAEGIEEAAARIRDLKAAEKTLYFIGNGASATMSSHYAIDFAKNAECRSLCFNDPAFLTAIGNDLGYENAFALPIERLGVAGDLLISISSSGNSPNIVKGIEAARSKGVAVATLSGMSPENRSRRMGDLNFYVPARTYGMVECAHHSLLHCVLDRFLETREWEPAP